MQEGDEKCIRRQSSYLRYPTKMLQISRKLHLRLLRLLDLKILLQTPRRIDHTHGSLGLTKSKRHC